MGSPTNVDHFVMWCSKVAISALRPLPTLNATFPPAPHYDLTHLVSCPSSTVFADCLPRHTLPPFSGRAAFTALVVLFSRPTTPGTPLPTSLSLIGLLPSVARGFQESSWGHAQIFRTVPSANTLVRWVNENAFAPVLRARPCPTFGRPVRPWGSPHRLRPGTSPHTLRIPPRDGHPVLRSTSSGGFRSVLLVSGFRLRALRDLSIPSSRFGQRGITAAFGYGAPHPSAGGTSTLLIWALPSAPYGPIRHLPRPAPDPHGCVVDQPIANRGRQDRLPLLRIDVLPYVLPPLPR